MKCPVCSGIITEQQLGQGQTVTVRVRTNEAFTYHKDCALHYVLKETLAKQYDDPYYD